MKIREWYKTLLYIFCVISNTPYTFTQEEAPLKISNRTNHSWIWVAINGEAPVKIWRSYHTTIPVARTAFLYVYLYDPLRTKHRQKYRISFDNPELNKVKYGLEVRRRSIIYRFVGTDTVQQHKVKSIIQPIQEE